MSDPQFHEEMSIIRKMIERTRQETFESGYLFVVPGIIWLAAVIVMGTLELTGHGQLVRSWGWIVTAVLILVSASIGFWEGRKEQAKTYTKHLFGQLWGACGIVIILTGFLAPHMNTYTPVAPLMIIGIGFYLTGVIYELPLVQASGVIWWGGMSVLGFVSGPVRLPIWVGVIFLGFILPGIVMNRQYRKRGIKHGA